MALYGGPFPLLFQGKINNLAAYNYNSLFVFE